MREPDRQLVEDLRFGYVADVDQSPWSLTPRMALQLVWQAQFVVDLAADDPDFFRSVGALPSIAVELASPEFLERFRKSFEDLVHRLRHPAETAGSLAQCVGDEVALAYLLRAAADCIEEPAERQVMEPELAALPEAAEFDSNFLFYEDVLFEDRDFELLFRDFSDEASADWEALAIQQPSLRPDGWFLPLG